LIAALVAIVVCLYAALKAAGRAADTRFVDLPPEGDEGNGRGTPPRP
jgi:hypothetical protein